MKGRSATRVMYVMDGLVEHELDRRRVPAHELGGPVEVPPGQELLGRVDPERLELAERGEGGLDGVALVGVDADPDVVAHARSDDRERLEIVLQVETYLDLKDVEAHLGHAALGLAPHALGRVDADRDVVHHDGVGPAQQPVQGQASVLARDVMERDVKGALRRPVAVDAGVHERVRALDVEGVGTHERLGEVFEHQAAGVHGLTRDEGQRRRRAEAVETLVGLYPHHPAVSAVHRPIGNAKGLFERGGEPLDPDVGNPQRVTSCSQRLAA